MSTVITPFQGTDSFSTATFNNRISQINTGFSYISNPNLLDNWYFGNPVNQRGGYVVPPGVAYAGESSGTTTKYYTVKSTYIYNDVKYAVFDVDGSECNVPFYACVRGYTGAGYGIDRWTANGCASLITDNGIKLIYNAGSQYRQILDNYAFLDGLYVTASVLFTDGTFASGTIKYDNSNSDWETHNFFTTKGVRFILAKAQGFTTYSDAANQIELKAIKLELGTQQTLAHQDENGNWVLNEIPDYGEQLARCQRVLIPVLPWVCYSGRIDNEGTAYIEIPTPVSMRSGDGVPVIIGAKNGLVYHASGLKDVTYGVVSFGANSVTISASGLGITNQVCSGCFANKVFLSKEL